MLETSGGAPGEDGLDAGTLSAVLAVLRAAGDGGIAVGGLPRSLRDAAAAAAPPPAAAPAPQPQQLQVPRAERRLTAAAFPAALQPAERLQHRICQESCLPSQDQCTPGRRGLSCFCCTVRYLTSRSLPARRNDSKDGLACRHSMPLVGHKKGDVCRK